MTVGSRLRRVARRVRGGPVEVPRETTLPPVFVGGTGRSGTTITARILGFHPQYHTFAKELKFLSSRRGLCDVAAGRAGFGAFRNRMVGDWLDRTLAEGGGSVLDRSLVEAALDRLDAELGTDPWAAAAGFTHRLLDPLAVAAGRAGWIEMTPDNALAAPDLHRMFSDLRVIHCIRDGRDAACSIAAKPWGPDDPDEALDWWADRLGRALRACEALPPDRCLTLQMESLIVHRREAEYARLLDFVGIEDHPAMRAFFVDRVTAERAHVGRWRSEIEPARRDGFDAHYRQLLAGLLLQWPELSLGET